MKLRPLSAACWLVALLLTSLVAACGGAAPATPVANAIPLATTTPPATVASVATAPVANATPILLTAPGIKYDRVQFTIPSTLANNVSARIVPKSDAGQDAPYWAVFPAYTELALVKYPAADSLHQARIEVYSVAEFGKVNPSAAKNIAGLQALLHGAPSLPTGKIPALPLFNAVQVFQAQVKFVDFKNGQGTRFVTQYGQGLTPINNHEVFYTYQGLTRDGAYYVAAVLPVHTAFLAPDEKVNSLVPPDGVLFPDLASGDAAALFTGYLQSVAGKLNTTAGTQFTPALDALDTLMQSVEVK